MPANPIFTKPIPTLAYSKASCSIDSLVAGIASAAVTTRRPATTEWICRRCRAKQHRVRRSADPSRQSDRRHRLRRGEPLWDSATLTRSCTSRLPGRCRGHRSDDEILDELEERPPVTAPIFRHR